MLHPIAGTNHKSMRLLAAFALLGALASIALGAAGATGAAKKQPAKKAGPIVTRSATVPLAPKEVGSAIATCPGKMKSVGGGFLGAPSGADQTLVTESRRANSRSWMVRGIRASALTTTSGNLTATVQCRKRAPKLKEVSASATLGAATTAGTVISGGATATCVGRRQKALSGGFAAQWDPKTVLGAIPQESRRVAKGRAWRFAAANGNQIAAQVTSFAYCGKASARATGATVSLRGDLATKSADAAGCRRPGEPLAGGFLTSPASLVSGGDVVFVLASQPHGRVWRGTGLHSGATSTGTLRSYLYCG
jgi:hypothetical protein